MQLQCFIQRQTPSKQLNRKLQISYLTSITFFFRAVINKPAPQASAPPPQPQMMRQQAAPQMPPMRSDYDRSYQRNGKKRSACRKLTWISAPPQNQPPAAQMRHDPRQQQARQQQQVKTEPRSGNDDDEKAKVLNSTSIQVSTSFFSSLCKSCNWRQTRLTYSPKTRELRFCG